MRKRSCPALLLLRRPPLVIMSKRFNGNRVPACLPACLPDHLTIRRPAATTTTTAVRRFSHQTSGEPQHCRSRRTLPATEGRTESVCSIAMATVHSAARRWRRRWRRRLRLRICALRLQGCLSSAVELTPARRRAVERRSRTLRLSGLMSPAR